MTLKLGSSPSLLLRSDSRDDSRNGSNDPGSQSLSRFDIELPVYQMNAFLHAD